MSENEVTGEYPCEELSIAGPEGSLEAVLEFADPGIETNYQALAVMCHPLGEGGNLRNKVINAAARGIRDLGVPTLKFNFRGCGGSDGEYGGGLGETEDLMAVLDWVASRFRDSEIWLLGYDFGGYAAIRACQKAQVAQLVTIAPPLLERDIEALPVPHCPWLIIHGDADERTPAEQVSAWHESLNLDTSQLLIMEDADHQFHRRLMDLKGAVRNGIRRQLRALDG